MTPEEVNENLRRAKLYIDFGNHPGKDRIPREAAMCGCCIITGRDGAAQFYEDVAISDEYKFDTTDENLPYIVNKIHNIMDDYKNEIDKFNSYRQKIIKEKEVFENEIDILFTQLNNKAALKKRISLVYTAKLTQSMFSRISEDYYVAYITGEIDSAKFLSYKDRLIPIINTEVTKRLIEDKNIIAAMSV